MVLLCLIVESTLILQTSRKKENEHECQAAGASKIEDRCLYEVQHARSLQNWRNDKCKMRAIEIQWK